MDHKDDCYLRKTNYKATLEKNTHSEEYLTSATDISRIKIGLAHLLQAILLLRSKSGCKMQLLISLGFHAVSHLVYLLPIAERNNTTLSTYFQVLIPSLSLMLHLVISQPWDKPGQCIFLM